MTEDDDLLAAELALGLLDADEAAVERQRAGPALVLRIEWWRDRIAELSDELAVAPPPQVWTAIERRLAVNDNPARPSSRWRNLAIGASSLAAALLVYVGVRPVPQPVTITRVAPAPLIAVLTGAKGTQVALRVDPSGESVRVVPAVLQAGRGDAELWVIPGDGKPRSLGIVSATAATSRAVPDAYRGYINRDSTFAVSLEPKGGSPTGSPTGPVVATGKLLII